MTTDSEPFRHLFPVEGNYDLIKATRHFQFETVLDVGFGHGGASLFFTKAGKRVTAIAHHLDFFEYPRQQLEDQGITLVESSMEAFEPGCQYDAIWASHVMEHTLNVGLFLAQCHRLLSPEGRLFIMVPPFKHEVVAGHVCVGWNLGILMYVLLNAGFDIKHGHFVRHGYNICAFVQKQKAPLPPMWGKVGEIEETAHLWPLAVHQDFNGNLDRVNWVEDLAAP